MDQEWEFHNRERVFFIANRLGKKISLDLNEDPITVGQAIGDLKNQIGKELGFNIKRAFDWCVKHNKTNIGEFYQNTKLWNYIIAHKEKPANTQTGSHRLIHGERGEYLSDLEVTRIQSFPDDYNYLNQDAGYVCGMSVPPFMTQRIALEIEKQLLDSK